MISELQQCGISEGGSMTRAASHLDASDASTQFSPSTLNPQPSTPFRPSTLNPQPSTLFAVPLTERDQSEFQSLPHAARELINNRLLIFEAIDTARSGRAAARMQSVAYGSARGYSVSTLLDLYYRYKKTGDWRVLIDRARSKSDTTAAQPREFITFWQQLCQRHKRSIIQARAELLRIWISGVNDDGKPTPVPGYGTWREWFQRTHSDPLPLEAPIPKGWSKAQLHRLKPGKAIRTLAVEGTAAARKFLPHNQSTRDGLRFMEKVTFDDVKLDWRVIDPRTGQVCDLWLLVAIDRATGLVLGYWMRPALAREDGSQQHLTLRDMKQLVGWMIFTWGLPPYLVTFKLERGTATLGQATKAAIEELFGGRIAISYSSMIAGKAPSGYAQRGVGNSRGKASHEATNNLLHNICDNLPGQTGPRYDRRPADLAAREKHARECWLMSQQLPPGLRDQVAYPIYTLEKARHELNRRFNWMNSRTEHELEGFDSFWEWRLSPQHPWQPMDTVPPGVQPEKENRRSRKHSPLERMHHLVTLARKTLGKDWDDGATLAPLIVRIYDTHRIVTINDRGEVEFDLDKKSLTFRVPLIDLPPVKKFLAYFNEQNPRFIHLTQPKPHSGYVCTCVLRERGRDGDTDALEESMRYTQAARTAAQQQAADLAAPDAARIGDIDRHNAALIAESNANRIAIDADIPSDARISEGGSRLRAGSSLRAAKALDASDASTPLIASLNAADRTILSDQKHQQRLALDNDARRAAAAAAMTTELLNHP